MEPTEEAVMETTPRPVPATRLNSKENPFLPGGDLSKETDDLLKRATIIRDQFLLDSEAKERLSQQSAGSSPPGGAAQEVTEGQITPANASPVEKPRENGQSTETASPGAVKVEVSKDTPASPKPRSADVPRDKKKRNKCCSVM